MYKWSSGMISSKSLFVDLILIKWLYKKHVICHCTVMNSLADKLYICNLFIKNSYCRDSKSQLTAFICFYYLSYTTYFLWSTLFLTSSLLSVHCSLSSPLFPSSGQRPPQILPWFTNLDHRYLHHFLGLYIL